MPGRNLQHPRHRLRDVVGLLVALVALLQPSDAAARWLMVRPGTGYAKASSLLPGQAPSATATGLSVVTVRWPSTTFTNGVAAPGYQVSRYNPVTGQAASVLAGCAGVVQATSCVESGVPTGAWSYAVTPVAGSWQGTMSGKSASVIVL
jgi:hypothetical protein